MPWWVSAELKALLEKVDSGPWKTNTYLYTALLNDLAFHLERNWWELTGQYGRSFELEELDKHFS